MQTKNGKKPVDNRKPFSKLNGFHRSIRKYGLRMATLQARNLGVEFIDAYVAIFGRMPRVL